eukprot:NODE_735_length_1941_cov_12.185518_g681_i0.p1 GENE.NODE_735_length_1941_cov_12.185518_g681_i0~~NODE_735_length_1941_cov_12.185518_g681_i0.p1  ORF type:complete len:474 (+),score=115.58 NODE_735_length_1941_cov_12.185518_g681_i0:233-1654(+)
MARTRLQNFLAKINEIESRISFGESRSEVDPIAASQLPERYSTACEECGARPNSVILKILETQDISSIHSLDISANYLGPRGCAALLTVIQCLDGLQSVDLSRNGVTSEVAASLALVLRNKPSVTSVDLSYNEELSFVDGKTFLAAVRTNPALSVLKVEGTHIPPDVIRLTSSAKLERTGSCVVSMVNPIETSGDCDGDVRPCCFKVQVGSQTTQGARSSNEDAHQVQEQSEAKFFGVYDGHGGKRAAEFLGGELHELLLQNTRLHSAPEQALFEAIMEAEKKFMVRAKEEMLDDGSTLAVVLLIGDTLIAANVGDSEIVLNRGGEPVILSTVHNMRKNPEEEERILGLGGRVLHKRLGHPNLNPHIFNIAVTRAIGDLMWKDEEITGGKPSGLIPQPHIQSLTLTENDSFVVIACDGLFDVMTHAEVIAFVASQLALPEGSTQKASEELVAEAMRRQSTDNITVIVVSLERL